VVVTLRSQAFAFDVTRPAGGTELLSVTRTPTLGDLERISTEAILQCQSPSGAFVASPDFSQYRYCWLRDGSFTAYAMDRVARHQSSLAYHAWVESVIDRMADMMDRAVEKRRAHKDVDPGELPPARFALDGSLLIDDWPNFQLDGYGTWLWSLREHLRLAGKTGLPATSREAVARTARYLATFAFDPCFDVWEMSGTAVHTSTLACVCAGLTAAAEMLGEAGLAARAAEVRDRLLAASASAGRFEKSSVSVEPDASTLWLAVPFRLVEADDPALLATIRAIERDLSFEGGVRRFPSDTYFGGGVWPVLTASLGLAHLSLGDRRKAMACQSWIEARFSASGELGEQFYGELLDRRMYDQWVTHWGPPARQLVWSHAMYLVLRAELGSSSTAAATATAG
jgi:GH15 family glucan-1,4-alpha-glucosidase